MATFEMKFRSKALGFNTMVNVILPDADLENPSKEPRKTLYLLHGHGGNYGDWMQKTSILRYATDHKIAVVMPDGGNSWYTDTCYGQKYFTYLTEELPAVCRAHFARMSDLREYNMIGGLSMGGYGAVKAALTYPEKYCGCASLSGALDVTRKGRPINMEEWRGVFGFSMQSADELEGTEHDVDHLLRNSDPALLPKLYLWCGTEDSLIGNNREYHRLLEELGVEHRYEESQGNHSWKWWDLHVQDAISYLLEE